MNSKPPLLMDARMVGPHLHGIARYAVSLARALRDHVPEWRPLLLLSRDAPEAVRQEFTHIIAPHPFLHPGEVFSLPAVAAQSRARVFHATSFSCSPWITLPWVMTLHDAIHLERPQDYGVKQRAYYRGVVEPASRRAAAILTVSHAASLSLHEHLGIPLANLHVIPNGVEPRFLQAPARARHAAVLTVAGPKPHKNTLTLLHALRHAPQLTLRVAGEPMEGLQDVAKGLGVADRVSWLGSLSDDALVTELCQAGILAFPSTAEGFGLPVLEAMATGCPVAISDIPVLREVGGDAVVTVPPLDPVAWARALRSTLADPGRLKRLSQAGRDRAAAFTWAATAQKTASVYELAASRLWGG